MANVRSAWGVDLGNRALKAVKLIVEGDNYRIADFEVIEHEQILSMAGDNKESLLQTALAQFVERHNMKGSVVSVGVSGQQSFARFIKLPPVEPKKIPEIVKFEAIQQIPFPLDEVEWSYQLFQQPDSPDVEVGIFAMKKELVNKQIGYFTSLGLNVQAVQMLPLAVYNAMQFDGQAAQTTMFMDAGAENTDLIIADNESVWLRTLPIGGNTFTEVLGKAFKLDFAKAEELKRNAATSKYAKQIFQAMRPVFDDLVAEIQRSMGFYATVHRDARIGKMVALGSTFQLPNLQKYLQQKLAIPVEKIDSFKALPPPEAKTAAALQEQMISLSGAYGLAIQAMGGAKITSSLLPETIRRQKMWQEKTKWFAAAAAAIIVASAGVAGRWYYENVTYEANAGLRQEIKSVIDRGNRQSASWRNEVEGQGEPDRLRLLNMGALLEHRDLWPALISDILLAVPTETPEKLKQIPRNQRKQIVIDSVTSQYLLSLKEAMANNVNLDRWMGKDNNAVQGWEAEAGPGVRNAKFGDDNDWRNDGTGAASTEKVDPNGQQRGFVVTIRGTTPIPKGSAATFIDQALVRKLLDKTPEHQLLAKSPYYVARADLVNTGPRYKPGNTPQGNDVFEDPEIFQGFGQADRDKKEQIDHTKDRTPGFTDESILEDIEFAVVVVVGLDPAAAAAAAAKAKEAARP